jgi:SNF2 family DNA or RNA helicase
LHDRGLVEDGAGLFMDMGLGKTAVVLQALTADHLPAVVFAPTRVAKEVWEAERDIWRPDLSVQVLKSEIGPTKAYPNGVDRRRALLRQADADVVVMPRDLAGDFGTRKHRYRTMILDELSGYKNKGTARWQRTRDVGRGVEHVWGMTGTPVPNGYEDLYGQVYLLDGGKRLGSSLTKYRDRYFDVTRIHPVTNIVIERKLKPGAEAAINALLEDLVVSMKARDYLKDLKEPVYNEVRVQMPTKAHRVYSQMEEDLILDISLLGVVHTAANAAVLSNRLRQISAGFLYYDQDTSQQSVLHTAKIEALGEVLDGTGDNVLTFYQFQWERDQILDKVPGTVSIDEPGAIKAWNRREIKALVAHPKSAGHGLNLQHGGSTLCYTSLPWSSEEWEQSVGRLVRQGQPNAVMVNWLNAAPVDEVVFQALKDKTSVQDALMNYLRERHLIL